MSQFIADVPDVIVKPGRMLGMGHWSPRAKAAVFLLCVALYIYLLLLLKTIYLKNQRLDRLSLMSADTEEMIDNLKNLDQRLRAKLDLLDDLHPDY